MRKPLLLLFAAALVVRLVFQLELRGSPLFTLPFGGAAFQHAWGVALAEGTAREGIFYHAPLYPYFLSAVYTVFGTNITVVRVLQAVLGAAACSLLALAGTRFFSRGTGLLAGGLLALYPPALLYEGIVKKTSLSLFLVTLFLAVVAGAVEQPKKRTLALAGVVLGLAMLTRENTLVLVPVVVGWLWLGYRARPVGQRLAWSAVFLTGCLVAPLAAGARNQLAGGELVLGTTNLGANVYIGNHAGASGLFEPLVPGHGIAAYDPVDARLLAEADVGRELSAREVSWYWLGRAWADISADPWAWALLLGRKAYYLVNARAWADDVDLSIFQDHSLVLAWLGYPLRYGVVLALAAAGALAAWPARRRAALLYASGIGLSLSIVLVFVVDRFRISLVPFLLLFAAHGLIDLVARVRAGRRGAAAASAGTALFVFGLVHLPAGREEWPRSATLNHLGLAYAEAGRVDEAMRWYRDALEERAENPAAHYNLGVQLLDRGRFEEGVKHLEEAARLEPAFEASCTLKLGAHWARRGDLERAEQYLMQSLDLDPRQPDLHYNLGLLYRHLDRLDEAEAAYREAIRLLPGYGEAHNNLGFLLALRGRRTEAQEEYERAVAAEPELVRARVNLSWLLATDAKLRDGAAALGHARRAHELAGDDVSVLESLAAAHAAAGDHAEASRVAQRLLALLRQRGDEEWSARVAARLADYRAGRATTE